MPRFPKKEADIVALAEWLWRGLFGNHPVYPQPPVHPIWLNIKSAIYLTCRNDFIAAKGYLILFANTARQEAFFRRRWPGYCG